MIDIQAFLATLADQGIELWADGEQLRYRGRKTQITAALLEQIRHYKAEILQTLGNAAQTNQRQPHSLNDAPEAAFPSPSETEWQKILVEWNNTALAYPEAACIHHLFEEQVAQTPDAVAVMAQSGSDERSIPNQLTYRQLNERANQLAHYLQALGVGTNDLVALCVERSLEMLIGLLGILKAGSAYLPLDPTYPRERLAFMLQDASPPVLVTQSPLSTQLPDTRGQIVYLDSDWGQIEQQSKANPVSEVQSKDLAYAIYTSGSTGQPKGVMIEHQSLVALTLATQPDYALTAHDRVLQFASLSFDVAVEEIFPCLISGATLVLRTSEMIQSVPTFLDCCSRWGITVLNLPTGFWEILTAELAHSGRTLPTALRLAIIGTEAPSPALVRTWWRQVGAYPRLVNAYGPTETTVTVTRYPLTEEWINGATTSATLPIGRPTANTRTYILDETLQPVPIGAIGELYIGGSQVARGYLNQPGLTNERFIDWNWKLPSANSQQHRLYKTGDQARYLPDGNIEFIGRADQQVKIRGFRIELGEIETVLRQHPAIQGAVVIACEAEESIKRGDKRLVAYLIQNSSPLPHRNGATDVNKHSTAPVAELRHWLQRRLPDYMIPADFVVLKSWPLTANGKLDRQALPAPGKATALAGPEFIPPRNATEQVIAEIWCEVIGKQQISMDDNFVELGGHSLHATQIMTRLDDKFQIQFPLSRFFENPTVAGLARLLTRYQATLIDQHTPTRPIAAIQPVTRTLDLPPSFAQEEAWLLSRSPMFGSLHQYNTVSLLRFIGQIDIEALRQSFNALVERHEILRTSYRQTTDAPWSIIQCIAPIATVDLPLLDLRSLTDQAKSVEIERLRVAEEEKLLDLTQSPLLRLTLVRLSSEEHILIYTTHHIGGDNWSLSILLHELETFYTVFSTGKSASLAPLPFQYADYAYWQRHFFTPGMLSERQRYWERLLATPLTRLNLPTDRPRPPAEKPQTYRARNESFALSSTLSNQLRQLSQQQSASLPMLLLAAYAALLYHSSGCEDLLIASPTNKRQQPGTELLIGHFAGMTLLRIDLAGAPSFVELLARVKNVLLAAITYQDIGLRQLLQVTGAEWLPHGRPQFQALFNFLQTGQRTQSTWPGLTVTPVNAGLSHTVTDIALTMWEESTNSADDTIHGMWIYRQDLFEAASIHQMSKDFQRVLETILADPTRPITDGTDLMSIGISNSDYKK